MKQFFLILLVLFLGCSKPPVKNEYLTKDTVSGEMLWRRITEVDPYKKYSFMPEHEGLLPGQSPHGLLHKIYANRLLIDSLPNPSKKAPYGSIIVKENYTINEEIDKITIMVKVKDYSPMSGDWYWVAYTKNGEVLAEGIPGGCISCHSGMKDNDYIIVKQLDH